MAREAFEGALYVSATSVQPAGPVSRSTGTVAAQALYLPCSAPVPKEVAAKYDQGKKSTYGQHVVATGPYMIQNDPKTGTITGT